MLPLENRMIVTPTSSLIDTLKPMTQEGFSQLLVIQDVTLMGMITKAGVLRFLEIKQVLGNAR
jgi:predicted transcriptional regulator